MAFIDAGGLARVNSVGDGAALIVLPGGVAQDTVSASGAHILTSGAFILAGTQVVSATTGILSGSELASNESEYVCYGGHSVDTTITDGTEYVLKGGVATGITVAVGTGVFVSGGAASGINIASGDGFQNTFVSVSEDGITHDTTVGSGAYEYVDYSGVTSDTTISGGTSYIYSKGVASSTMVSSGGGELIYSGGETMLTTVDAGGAEYVTLGGVEYRTTVSAGGEETISSGGTASLTHLLPGGTIDVAYLPYVSGGSVGYDSTTHLLTVSEGGQTYTQTLAGTYSGESFHLAAAPFSGTDITVTDITSTLANGVASDPPLSAKPRFLPANNQNSIDGSGTSSPVTSGNQLAPATIPDQLSQIGLTSASVLGFGFGNDLVQIMTQSKSDDVFARNRAVFDATSVGSGGSADASVLAALAHLWHH
jgi:autotransporter passenger strand-loop-strand repeat protein